MAEAPSIRNVIHLDATSVVGERLQEMLEEIRRGDKTLSAQMLDTGITGFTADHYHDMIRAFNMRVVLMSEAYLRGFLQNLYTTFGESVCSAFLYHVGAGSGRAIAQFQRRLFEDPHVCIRVVEYNSVAFGHGRRLTIRKVAADVFEIIFEGLFECEFLAGKKGPTSHLMRGIIAAYFEELFGGKWETTEVKCINSGDDVCMFRVVRH